MTFLDLRQYPLIYLASPYTNYEHGIQVACEHICQLAARLIERGLAIYSPIAHSHAIAIHGDCNPLNHFLWMRLDRAMVNVADVLLIAKMAGWRESAGVKKETEWFRQAGKPVFWIDPESMEVT